MNCPHLRWLINTPDGDPLLRGRCKGCGATKTWPAAPNEGNWNRSAKARLKVMEKERELEGVV